MEIDDVSGEDRQEKRTFACFWRGIHESVAIRRKSDVRAHCRANRQSESEMGPWNLGWRGSNDSDECIIPRENGVQKVKSLHRVTPKEKFLISELEKARKFPWNDVAENLKSAIETHQDQGPFGHLRMRLTIEIVMRIGARPGCSGCDVGCDREEHWLTRKKARVRKRSEQELDHFQK